MTDGTGMLLRSDAQRRPSVWTISAFSRTSRTTARRVGTTESGS
jgi:hypothetical protein